MASQKLDLNSKDLVVRSIKTLKGSAAAAESSKVRTRVLQNELVLQKIYGQITLQGQGIEDAASAASAAASDAAAAQVRAFATSALVAAATGQYDGELVYCYETASMWICDATLTAWTNMGASIPSSQGLVGVWLCNEVPEIPDNAAGITYLQDQWLTVDGWRALGGGSLSVAGGIASLSSGCNYLNANPVKAIGGAKTVKIRARQTTGDLATRLYVDYYDSTTLTSSVMSGGALSREWKIFTYEASNITSLRNFWRSNYATVAGIMEIDWIYVGTGDYTSPAVDASGHGLHGTLYGPTPVDGDSGRALRFDGVNDYILATLPSAQNLLTLSIRATVLGVGAGSALFSTFTYNGNSSGYGINLCAQSADVARIYVGRTGTTYQYKDIAHTWDLTAEHDYKLIYDTTTRTASLWVDGILKGTTTAFDETANPASDRLVVGRWATDHTSYYCQMIASHAIAYTRALSAPEIRGLSLGLKPTTSYRLIDWKVDPTNANNIVTTYAPKYLGKYLDSAPTAHAIGDTYCRYSATSGTTNRGVFKWSGTAWVRTEVQADIMAASADIAFIIAYKNSSGTAIYGTAADYTSDSTIQADYAFFQAAFIGFLEANNIKVRKSMRGGDRYDETGAVVDRTVPGFFIGASGACKVAGIEFEGSQGGGVQWGAPTKIGNALTVSVSVPDVVGMTPGNILLINGSTATAMRWYSFDGETLVLLGTQSDSNIGTYPCGCRLSDTTFAILKYNTKKVAKYSFNGTTFSQIGSDSAALSSVAAGTSACPLEDGWIAVATNAYVHVFEWVTDHYILRYSHAISGAGYPAITYMGNRRIAYLDCNNKILQEYSFNTNYSSMTLAPGTLSISGAYTDCDIVALNNVDVLYRVQSGALYIAKKTADSWVNYKLYGNVGASSAVISGIDGIDFVVYGSGALQCWRLGFFLTSLPEPD